MKAILPLFLCGCTFLVGDAGEDAGVGFDFSAPCDPSRLASDVRNCGACGRDCTQLPGVDSLRVRCSAGSCDLTAACQAARGDCTAADGCETDFSSRNSCGGCGRACSGVAPFCVASATGQFFCSAACGGATPDLCGSECVDTQQDPRHCGSCFAACPAPLHAKATCLFGCDFECDAGFVRSGSSCLAAVGDMAVRRDLAIPRDFSSTRDLSGADFAGAPDFAGLPPCDCTGITDPLGSGNQCPLTSSCVGNNCCAESQILGTPCTDNTPCAPSTTPQ